MKKTLLPLFTAALLLSGVGIAPLVLAESGADGAKKERYEKKSERHAKYCAENPQRCEEMKAKRDEWQAKCEADPEACKKRHHHKYGKDRKEGKDI